MVASPGDAGDSGTAARRVAAPRRPGAVLRRRAALWPASVARRGGSARDRRLAGSRRRAGRLAQAGSARAARRLARALDRVVRASGPLLGLREQDVRLRPVRGARTVAVGTPAGARTGADGAAWRR